MKSVGVVRRIDELGRIVLPIELRRAFDLDYKDPVEIYTDKDCIILKKYSPSCIFCGNKNNIENFGGKNICPECIEKISKLKK
ncbi:MAG: AbrB/MazE/SpoVT family DNA-binding domain-containing protein [Clostridiales bacterium]|nr:AbrB/MazE/SpoVT family DNA-binding domain-containing protein [Clostridiales bacterium]